MRFINLEEFISPEVEIISDGITYNLYTDADFYGVCYNSFNNQLCMTWHYPNPGSFDEEEFRRMDNLDEYLKARGMEWDNYFLIHLTFKHVLNYKISGWDIDYPFDELFSLRGIIFDKSEDHFYFEFVFCNELRVEIKCKEVEFTKELLQKDIKKTFVDFKRSTD